MAVAVPLIMAATGASAAIGAAIGVGALAVSVGTSLVLGAVGVNAKIDKAASKVFGKDLVTIGNLAGMAYGAMGGFAGDSAATVWNNAKGLFGAAAGSGSGAAASGAATQATPSVVTALNATNPALAESAVGNPMYGVSSASPAAVAPAPGGVLSGVKGAWNNMSGPAQAAVIQVGGQALAGYSAGKAKEAELEEQRRRDALYRGGSGVTTWAPGALANFRSQYVQPAAIKPT